MSSSSGLPVGNKYSFGPRDVNSLSGVRFLRQMYGYRLGNRLRHSNWFRFINSPSEFLSSPEKFVSVSTKYTFKLFQELLRRCALVRRMNKRRVRVSQATLAASIGCSRETVNRLLPELERWSLVGVGYSHQCPCTYEVSPVFFSRKHILRFAHLFRPYVTHADLFGLSVHGIKNVTQYMNNNLLRVKSSRILYSARARAREICLDPRGPTMKNSDFAPWVGQNKRNWTQKPLESANNSLIGNKSVSQPLQKGAGRKNVCNEYKPTLPAGYQSARTASYTPYRPQLPKGYKSESAKEFNERRRRELREKYAHVSFKMSDT